MNSLQTMRIENFKKYNANRWPNAAQLLEIEIIKNRRINISMIGHTSLFFADVDKLVPENFWHTEHPLIPLMDYFDNIKERYRERRLQHISNTFTCRVMEMGFQYHYAKMISYLSTWFQVKIDYVEQYKLFFINHQGNVVIELNIKSDGNQLKQLYDYFCQCEKSYKIRFDACMAIANEIMEYY